MKGIWVLQTEEEVEAEEEEEEEEEEHEESVDSELKGQAFIRKMEKLRPLFSTLSNLKMSLKCIFWPETLHEYKNVANKEENEYTLQILLTMCQNLHNTN